jgi:hypothetical protein
MYMHACIVYNGHDRMRPRNLNRENIEDWPSLKIGPHEKFPLFGVVIHILILYTYMCIIMLCTYSCRQSTCSDRHL